MGFEFERPLRRGPGFGGEPEPGLWTDPSEIDSAIEGRIWQLIESALRSENVGVLLGILIEMSPALNPAMRAAIRHVTTPYVEKLAESLRRGGIDASAGEVFLAQRRFGFGDPIPTPPGYPSRQDFEQSLARVIRAGREVHEFTPDEALASDVARFAQGSWDEVKPRGRSEDTRQYLYDLGKVMAVQGAYETIFTPHDPMIIGGGWEVENGRHRSLTLRALGPHYVESTGMNEWVTVSMRK